MSVKPFTVAYRSAGQDHEPFDCSANGLELALAWFGLVALLERDEPVSVTVAGSLPTDGGWSEAPGPRVSWDPRLVGVQHGTLEGER